MLQLVYLKGDKVMKRLWAIMTIYDLGLIVFIIIISLLLIIFPIWKNMNANSADKTIIISQDGKIFRELSCEDTYEKPIIIKVNGPIGMSVIEAFQGKVRIKKAPEKDPEKICEKTGWIKEAGPTIICVPNKISIWIESKENKLDGVTW